MNVEGRYLGRFPEALQDVMRQNKARALLPKPCLDDRVPRG
jgi:hypothetical protein